MTSCSLVNSNSTNFKLLSKLLVVKLLQKVAKESNKTSGRKGSVGIWRIKSEIGRCEKSGGGSRDIEIFKWDDTDDAGELEGNMR